MGGLSLASLLLGAPVLLVTGYLGVLALLARRPRPPEYGPPSVAFAVVVPAHNEEENIAKTVESLLALDYPRERFEVVVVADNCSDATAERAREAGARVLERSDDVRRGKGYALEHAFDLLLEEARADAFVVVDADTVVSANLLRAFAHRLEAGESAVQAEYGVSNVNASWRTQLMTLALAMFHDVRSLARERLKLSAGLRGNGMCFSRALLEAHPHKAYGLVEDVEYGIAIGLHGHRVAYAFEAEVLGEMVSGGRGAATQRKRWEGGRLALFRSRFFTLLRCAVERRDAVCLDLALDLAVPPLSYVGLLVSFGLVVEAILFVRSGGTPTPSLAVWALSLPALFAYVARGVQHAGLGARGWLVLSWAPVYVAWKLLLVRPWRRERRWIRTEREAERRSGE